MTYSQVWILTVISASVTVLVGHVLTGYPASITLLRLFDVMSFSGLALLTHWMYGEQEL